MIRELATQFLALAEKQKATGRIIKCDRPIEIRPPFRDVARKQQGDAHQPTSDHERSEQSLTARLDRLGSAREVAQVGAVIGRDFSVGGMVWMPPCSRRSNRKRVTSSSRFPLSPFASSTSLCHSYRLGRKPFRGSARERIDGACWSGRRTRSTVCGAGQGLR